VIHLPENKTADSVHMGTLQVSPGPFQNLTDVHIYNVHAIQNTFQQHRPNITLL